MSTARPKIELVIPRPLLRVAFRSLVLVSVFALATSARAQDAKPAQDVKPAADAKPAAKAYRYWTTNWSLSDVSVGRLVDRLAGIGIELPVEVQGDVSVDLRVGVPLNGLRDAAAYRLEGRLSAGRLRIEKLQLSDFLADIEYRDGVLKLSKLETAWRGADPPAADPRTVVAPQDPPASLSTGSVRGQASVQLVPRGDVVADIDLQDVAMGPLADLIRRFDRVSDRTAISGEVTGSAKLRCHVDDLSAPRRWELTAALNSPRLEVGRLPAVRFDTGEIRIDDARLRIPDSEIAYVDNPQVRCTTTVEAHLDEPREFEACVIGNDLPTEEIASLFRAEGASSGTPVQGKVDLNVRGRGDIDNGRWNVVGRIASPGLHVMGFDLGLLEHEVQTDQKTFRMAPIGEAIGGEKNVLLSSLLHRGIKVGRVTADYRLTPESFRLKRMDAEVFGGHIKAAASLARTDDEQQNAIDLRWQSIASEFPLPNLGIAAARASAESSGKIDWTFPAGRWDAPLQHRGSVELSLSEMKVADVDIGKIDVAIRADGETIDAAGDGELLGGKVSFETAADIASHSSWADVLRDAWRTQLRWESIQLSSAVFLVRPDIANRLRGELSGSLAIAHRADADDHGDDSFPVAPGGARFKARTQSKYCRTVARVWAGNIQLRDFFVQGRPVTPRLQLQLRGDESRVVVDRIAGRYAEGQLSATGVWSLDSGQRQMSVRATSVNVPLALLPVWRDAHDWVAGHASLQATVSGHETVAARGSLQWHDGHIMDVPVDGGHGAFHGRVHTKSSRWQADFERLHLQLGRGTVESALHLSSAGRGRGFDMTSSSKARRVDFARLLKTEAGAFSLADSRASGELTLGGKAIRDLGDLTGRFDVALNGTDARAVPGLLKTQAYLGAASLASVRFDEGRMRGIVGGGAIKLHEFWLISNRLRVFADGSIRLGDGRMDMAAVLNTGDFQAQNFLLRQVANVASGGIAVPLDLIVEVNQVLSDRTLIVDLTGPVGNPRVRLNTVKTLRENAVQFFLRQARRGVTAAVIGVSNE